MTDHSMKKIGKAASRETTGATDAFEFPVEMTEIGPQFVIPGCERTEPVADATNGGKA